MPNSKRLFDIQLELLNNELRSIDGAIRQQDELTKSVKNWAVVTWTASIGLALKAPELNAYVWLTAIVPLVFWVVDGSFRRIQRSFICRVEQISTYLNSPSFKAAAISGEAIDIQLLTMRVTTDRFKDTLFGTMCFRSVALLYVGLAACSLAVWYARYGYHSH